MSSKTTSMRLQVLFSISFAIFSTSAHATECFDFSQKIDRGIRTPHFLAPKGASASKDSMTTLQDSGSLPSGIVWAAIKGQVNRSLQDLFEELATHETTKSGRTSEMKITQLDDPHFRLRQKVHFIIKPFPLINISWTEDWAFSHFNQNSNQPERILVPYEKTEGTSHIKHLCGNIELTRKGDHQTEVFIYEEAKATGRSQEDTLSGIKGTLHRLQFPQGNSKLSQR